MLRKLEIGPPERANAESTATWLYKTLSTITPKAFTKLTISVVILTSHNPASETQVHSADNMLDQLSLCEDVSLVVSPPQHCAVEDRFKGVVEKSFPSMWKKSRVVVVISLPNEAPEGRR